MSLMLLVAFATSFSLPVLPLRAHASEISVSALWPLWGLRAPHRVRAFVAAWQAYRRCSLRSRNHPAFPILSSLMHPCLANALIIDTVSTYLDKYSANAFAQVNRRWSIPGQRRVFRELTVGLPSLDDDLLFYGTVAFLSQHVEHGNWVRHLRLTSPLFQLHAICSLKIVRDITSATRRLLTLSIEDAEWTVSRPSITPSPPFLHLLHLQLHSLRSRAPNPLAVCDLIAKCESLTLADISPQILLSVVTKPKHPLHVSRLSFEGCSDYYPMPLLAESPLAQRLETSPIQGFTSLNIRPFVPHHLYTVLDRFDSERYASLTSLSVMFAPLTSGTSSSSLSFVRIRVTD